MFQAILARIRRIFTPDKTRIDAREAQRLQKEGALLIDVRETIEWRGGHAPGAKHIPLGQITEKAATLPRDRPIIVTCSMGMRSRVAAKRLRAAGFTDIRDIKGGMGAWRRSGLPTQK